MVIQNWFLSFFKRSVEIPQHEIPIYRIWSFSASLFISIYGLILTYLDPNAIEYQNHRYIISAFWLLAFFSSFFPQSKINNLGLLVILGNLITTAWVIWIVHVNSYSGNYCIGLILTLSGLGITFRRIEGIVVYYVLSLFLLGISFYYIEETIVNKQLLITTVFMLSVMFFTITFGRQYLNKQIFNANKALSNKIVDLKQFTRIASHDLKSPLRSIGSFATLLDMKLGDQKDETLQLYLLQINKGVKRMNNLLSDLQNFDNVGDDRVELKTVDLNEILTEIIQGLEMDEKFQDYKIERKGPLPSFLICNPSQITQLFQNLIENGIKYNHSSPKQIVISANEDNEFWNFEVKDNGIGISKEYRKQVFKIFQRLHGDGEYEGTGMGLAICNRIIENHNGQISIQSNPHGGSIFHFSLSKQLQA